ncbi:hypothetical protein F5146DRAFT_443896 [Armillaria mellea]|nr:hypothetical protein F5146DRAFT_443896 [Armillaria mellea]
MNTNAFGSFYPFPFPAILESTRKPGNRIYLGGMFFLALFAVPLCASHIHRIPRSFHLVNHRPNISVSQTLNAFQIGRHFVSPFWHVTGGFITIHWTGDAILFLMIATYNRVIPSLLSSRRARVMPR